MVKNIKKSICLFVLIILILFSNITGILQIIAGSAFAEGSILILVSLLIALLLFDKLPRFNIYDYIALIVAIYSIFITVMNIFFNEVEGSALLGLYYYTVPAFIFINRRHPFFSKYKDLYFKIFFIFIFINALYAICQTFAPLNFMPNEYGRARGLMKTTLNFSGLIGIMYAPLLALNLKNKIIKYLGLSIIFLGGMCSLSKGLLANIICALVFFPILQFIVTKKINFRQIIKHFFIVIFFVIIAAISINLIINNFDFLLEKFSRLFYVFDYKNDESNTMRIGFWSKFLEYFLKNPFGYGVGQIASGTSFVKNSVNFESYILDTIYSIGIFSLFYFLLPLIWIYNRLKNTNSKINKYIYIFIIGLVIQNAVQPSMLTPTTLVITWLNIIFFTNYIRSKGQYIYLERNYSQYG